MSNAIKEKYKVSVEHPRDNVNEGTAARTRPFSFQEIMLRRKFKKLHSDADRDPHYKENNKEIVESVSNSAEGDGVFRGKKNSVIVVTKHTSVGNVEGYSRKKEETNDSKQGTSLKGKGKETDDIEAEPNDIVDKGRGLTAKEESKGEKKSHGRARNKEHLVSKKENGYKMKRSDDANGKEKYRDIEREQSAIESKRKHQSRDRDENKHRLEKDESYLKRHKSGKSYMSEPAEKKYRKKVLSPPRYEEAKSKRRRSRSLETRVRDERSISLSPRSRKHPYHGHDYGNSSHRSSKEKRQHFDDKKRISKNGGYAGSHHRNNGGHESKLGGYSPRKRRTEAAARSPSPTIRSPEKKTAGWDQPPMGTGASSSVSMISTFQSSNQISLSAGHELSVPPLFLPSVSKTSVVLPHAMLIRKDVSIDSIQLTQATRPMRRLYVENLPASAGEKALMECLNNFLLSSGASHIHRTDPCISCIVNKEKGQAVVEFLTPEDATAALSFDGKAFSGSNLKVRRPKDYVETTTAGPEKSAVPVDVSNIVKDTPYKIFIGGISKLFSSDTLMEIAGAFGSLKAFHFTVDADLNEPVAFLEYMDSSNTNKACAGLNGMKLGGQVLTVMLAAPGSSFEEISERPPCYEIPENAKPLLSIPTRVLKLKNVFDEKDLSSLSAAELEETLEDVRLECIRFGIVKSINVVRNECSTSAAAPQLYEVTNECNFSALQDRESESVEGSKTIVEDAYQEEVSGPNNSENVREPSDQNIDKPDNELAKDGINELCQQENVLVPEVPTRQYNADANLNEASQSDAAKDQQSDTVDACQSEDSNIKSDVMVEELEPVVSDAATLGASDHPNGTVESEPNEIGKCTPQAFNADYGFGHGCIMVEFTRAEAACMAAHCLHGRLYGDRMVEVSYVGNDLYLSRFPR